MISQLLLRAGLHLPKILRASAVPMEAPEVVLHYILEIGFVLFACYTLISGFFIPTGVHIRGSQTPQAQANVVRVRDDVIGISYPRADSPEDGPPCMEAEEMAFFTRVNSLWGDDYRARDALKVVICVPFFSEESDELLSAGGGTLRELEKMIAEVRRQDYQGPLRGRALHVYVVVIQDGHEKMHASAQDLLHSWFGDAATDFEDDIIEELKMNPEYQNDHPVCEVNVRCLTKPVTWERLGGQFILLGAVKKHNRGKHNSHAWALHFSRHLQPHYVMLTDCGTEFDISCLSNLLQAMEDQPRLIAATGQMHARSRDGRRSEGYSALEPLQMYEVLSSFRPTTAGFHWLGMLPVMPGPCQVIRWRSTHTKMAVQKYLSFVKPLQQGQGQQSTFWHRSFRRTWAAVAEDRVFTILLGTESEHAETRIVENSHFFYIPMKTIWMLLQQRRRWINGATAVIELLLTNEPGGFDLPDRLRPLPVLLLLALQVYIDWLTTMGPALIAVVITCALDLQDRAVVSKGFKWTQLHLAALPWAHGYLTSSDFVGFAYVLCFMAWAVLCYVSTDKVKLAYAAKALLIINRGASLLLLHSLFMGAVIWDWPQGLLTVYVGFLAMMPAVLAMSSPGGWRGMWTMRHYLMDASWYTNALHIFAKARYWDASWGTLETEGQQRHDRIKAELTGVARRWLVMAIFGNLAVYYCLMLLIHSTSQLNGAFVLILLSLPSFLQLLFATGWVVSLYVQPLVTYLRTVAKDRCCCSCCSPNRWRNALFDSSYCVPCLESMV